MISECRPNGFQLEKLPMIVHESQLQNKEASPFGVRM
jgi:hypothetical protein